MKEFTLRNFFKQWKALLPLTIILTFAGLIGGLIYNNSQKQHYSVTSEITVVNATVILPEDFITIINSKTSVGDRAYETAKVDKKCSYKAVKNGKIPRITSTCYSSAEDAEKLDDSVIASVAVAVDEIYDNETYQVKTVTKGKSRAQINTTDRVLYVTIPAVTGLAISAFIAFVKLDLATSKKRK